MIEYTDEYTVDDFINEDSEPVNNTIKFMSKRNPGIILDTAKNAISKLIDYDNLTEYPDNQQAHPVIIIPVNAENQYFVDFLKSKNIGTNMVVKDNKRVIPGQYHAIYYEEEITHPYESHDFYVSTAKFVKQLNRFGLNAIEQAIDNDMRII